VNDPSTYAVHRLLSGRYALEEHLGSGGAGAVWRAHDRLLDRTVAVKLLHAEVAQDHPAAARFRTEASMAAKLTHPNAVIVFDIGRDDEHDYLVMEFVEGGTLSDVLAGGPLAPGVVAGFGAQVGRALGAAHHRRLVHRDVKPANVLITTDGDAKVADFGIAQALGTTGSRLTAPGQIMGTARYLAPEQLRGESVDGRADVYALGIVLHEALTGDVPFGEGTTAEVAARRLVASLPPVSDHRSDVPFALDDAIARATQLEPEDRFVDGRAFAAELSRSSTPGARRELAARLGEHLGGTPAVRDEASVTAELDEGAAFDTGPGSAAALDGRRVDEPTATMVARATPLPSLRPEPLGPSRIVTGGDPASGGPAPERVEPADEPAVDDGGDTGNGAPPRGAPGSTAAGATASPEGDRVPNGSDSSVRPAVAPDPEVGQGTDGPDDGRRASRRRRPVLAMYMAVAVLIGGGAVMAALDRSEMAPPRASELAGEDRDDDGPDATADAVADDEEDESGDAGPLEVVAARDHDPFGSGEEHRADVANAFDGDEGTVWQTQGYRGSPELGGLKSGVGIWLDLGDAQEVAELEVALAAPGASFTVYSGDEPPEPGADPDSWGRPVAEVANADGRTRLALEQPTEDRVWLLWFTSLPRDGSVYRASVADVRLLSS
jgi:eukaryotic-like serine/threonine-protein kinase